MRGQLMQPTVGLQGVDGPPVVVNPDAFYPATRGLIYPMKTLAGITGLGSGDSVQLRQTGIVSGLLLRVTGTLVFGGTITGTSMSWRWPYNILRGLRLAANGQSNLINCNGLQLKWLEFQANTSLNDRGVARNIGAAVGVNQGTLSLAHEDWGTSGTNLLGPGVTVPATGTYTVDLEYFVPVAADQISLVGAIFAQTAATNLTCDVDWETQNQLLTLGGAATLTTNLQWAVDGIVYSIPNVGGQLVVPDLSQFHQIAGFRTANIAQGDNEILLPGTGVGRQLLRVGYQVTQGATPQPLAMSAANFGQQAWRYGGNDTPASLPNGTKLRQVNERQSGCDIGRNWGFGAWDFATEFALRDSVDEGQTSDLRLLVNLVNAPTNPFAEVVQETLFAAPVGA